MYRSRSNNCTHLGRREGNSEIRLNVPLYKSRQARDSIDFDCSSDQYEARCEASFGKCEHTINDTEARDRFEWIRIDGNYDGLVSSRRASKSVNESRYSTRSLRGCGGGGRSGGKRKRRGDCGPRRGSKVTHYEGVISGNYRIS